jgi:hypothetical protein
MPFKTEDIQGVYTKQVHSNISNETAPLPLSDEERANALGNVLLEIIFRGAENDPDYNEHDDKPQPQLEEGQYAKRKPRRKPATEKR